jgi:hypothetical protein
MATDQAAFTSSSFSKSFRTVDSPIRSSGVRET